jgi:hypothetical protein
MLLALERCTALVTREGEMNSRRMSRLLIDLRYACKLAEDSGIRNGWVRGGPGLSFVVFELGIGDVAFSTFDETVGTEPFPRVPMASSNNSSVLARAIAQLMTQAKGSAARRSTRITTDVLVEVQGDGFAYAGETITVNLHGALVRVVAPLKHGDRVNLHVHSTGKSALGTVVFANSGLSQFGIELQDPGDIWDVGLPPADWHALSPESVAR